MNRLGADIVQYDSYVAAWADSSIHEFLQTSFPRNSRTMAYALVTCLDSVLEPSTLFHKSLELKPIAKAAITVGKGFLLPTKLLLEVESVSQIFYGFDEVWFFPTKDITPKPNTSWLVGPNRIDQVTLNNLGPWMTKNQCSLGLGDGVGLNFTLKAHGIMKYMLSLSLSRPEPVLQTGDERVEKKPSSS